MLSSAIAAGSEKQFCNTTICAAGTQAVTYTSKHETFYGCPNRELAEYTNTVLGMVAASSMLSGQLPNISDKTGEPEYEGESKMMLDTLRAKAGVTSFDQAASRCFKGRNKVNVIILNRPANSGLLYVMDEKNKKTFWLPNAMVYKR